ncbi:MAG: GntR family transcriptional regulator [Anaerolineales bacterium]|nr:GntR family transcriptional regulator [Anaerolineales bacterium]
MQNQSAKTSLPKYRQIEEELRYKILFGHWKPGHQILTEMELCAQYNVSRITIRKAINELENAGYLVRQSGKGTFVTDWQANLEERPKLKSFTNEMHALGKKAVTVEVELEVTQADKILSGILSVPEGHPIIQLKRVRAVEGGVLIGYSINTFPFKPEFSTDPADYKESFYEYLGRFGIFFNSALDYLEATLPPAEVAEKLHIAPSEPVLKSVKISHSTDRLFSEYNLCYYVGSEYRYYVKY